MKKHQVDKGNFLLEVTLTNTDTLYKVEVMVKDNFEVIFSLNQKQLKEFETREALMGEIDLVMFKYGVKNLFYN